jgi:hypothetical protein
MAGQTDRELLLKEAEWIYQDAAETRRVIERLQVIYFGALYGITVWIFTRILNAPPIQSVDSPFAVFRRPDIALVMCSVPVISTGLFLMLMESVFRWLRLHRALGRLAAELGESGRWQWRGVIDFKDKEVVGFWRDASVLYRAAIAQACNIAALVLSFNAALRYPWLLVCWCLSLITILTGISTFIRFTRMRNAEAKRRDRIGI